MTENASGVQHLKSFQLPPGFRGRSAFVVQLWWLIQATLFACSPQFMFGWRRWLLQIFGANVGRGVKVRPSVKVTYPWKVIIGDFAWIGDDVVLYSLGEIEIGANAVVSQRSYLCAASHDFTQSDFPIESKKICISAYSWLATDVFVAPGVTIGEGAVVGARSSVFHDLPPMMVCFGSPAKPVKSRFRGASCEY
ncbi:putative colanic acid biosynthesis acetyltransferase [Ferrigenium sp. UT5]|uniref:putative colanic acid biosynthesis acetyltransferase n=1 Tax=Ferrigenium sp. UT5 TaxID=3242105 RepID=UPI0038B234B9